VAVYVDPAMWPYGRMMMCHLFADTHAELLAMVDTIGVQRKWIQHRGRTKFEHFDICKSKRALAVKAGAIEVDMRQYPAILDARTKETYYG
jgi:hypothetical protein